jgi:thiol-disulfide isomerase/thioredoxin
MTNAQPPTRKGPNILLLAGIGIVLLGIVAVLLTRGGGGDDKTPADQGETRAVDVAGDALTRFEDPADDAGVGTLAPVLTGETFAGDKVTIGEPGTPQLIVFVAHWCPHCQREVPFLVGYFEDNGMPEGVDVFGVATSINPDQDNYPPSAWLEREKWTIPTLVDADDSGAANAYGLSAFPYFVALHADGTVAARVSGELDGGQLEALIAAAKG